MEKEHRHSGNGNPTADCNKTAEAHEKLFHALEQYKSFVSELPDLACAVVNESAVNKLIQTTKGSLL